MAAGIYYWEGGTTSPTVCFMDNPWGAGWVDQVYECPPEPTQSDDSEYDWHDWHVPKHDPFARRPKSIKPTVRPRVMQMVSRSEHRRNKRKKWQRAL